MGRQSYQITDENLQEPTVLPLRVGQNTDPSPEVAKDLYPNPYQNKCTDLKTEDDSANKLGIVRNQKYTQEPRVCLQQENKQLFNECQYLSTRKEVKHVNRIVHESDSFINSLVKREQLLIYDRNIICKRHRIFQLSSYAIRSNKFPLLAVPSQIAKPNQSDSYRCFLIAKSLRFDRKQECFTFDRFSASDFLSLRDKRRGHIYLKSEFQILLNLLQPDIKFGNVGFSFSKRNVEENLQVIEQVLSKSYTFDANCQIYFEAKLESIRSIYFTSKGKLGKARKRLRHVENSVSFLEPCEWTAWFFIARFYYRLRFLRKKSAFQHHKRDLYLDLDRARQAFYNEGGEFFALERSILLWWMFLSQADLIDYAADTVSGISQKSHVQLVEQSVKLSMATQLLERFKKEKSELRGFPEISGDLERIMGKYTQVMPRPNELPSKRRKRTSHKAETPKLLQNGTRNGALNSAGTLTTEEETDTQILLDDQLQLLMLNVEKHFEGLFPSCVDEISLRRDLGKIAVYTTKPGSERLKGFLEKIGTPATKWHIEQTRGFQTFAGNPRLSIQPGFPLTKKTQTELEQYLNSKSAQPMGDGSYGPLTESALTELGSLGQIGFAVKDRGGKKTISIVSASHDLGLGERRGEGFILCGRWHPTERCYRLQPLSKEYTGFYGTKVIGKTRYVIDSLLVELSNDILKKDFLDLSFRRGDCSGKKIGMQIYTGDIKEVRKFLVKMIDFQYRSREVEGTIINPDVGYVKLCIAKSWPEEWQQQGKGAFAVALANGHEEQNFAREGHSGNLVYCYDDENGIYYALGLVWGSPLRPYTNDEGKTYNHVTYVLPLWLFFEYHKPKEFEFYVPEDHLFRVDSGYTSENTLSETHRDQNQTTLTKSQSAPSNITSQQSPTGQQQIPGTSEGATCGSTRLPWELDSSGRLGHVHSDPSIGSAVKKRVYCRQGRAECDYSDYASDTTDSNFDI